MPVWSINDKDVQAKVDRVTRDVLCTHSMGWLLEGWEKRRKIYQGEEEGEREGNIYTEYYFSPYLTSCIFHQGLLVGYISCVGLSFLDRTVHNLP